MAFSNKTVERLLQSKFGFVEDPKREKGHKWYKLKLEGVGTIRTKVSHSNESIGDPLENRMAKQLRVQTQFFKGMFECTRSCEEYYQKVKDDPHGPWACI